VVSLFIPQRSPGPNAAGYECIKNARFAYTFRFGGQHFNTTVWVFDPKKPKMGVRSIRCGFQEYEVVEYLDNDKRWKHDPRCCPTKLCGSPIQRSELNFFIFNARR